MPHSVPPGSKFSGCTSLRASHHHMGSAAYEYDNRYTVCWWSADLEVTADLSPRTDVRRTPHHPLFYRGAAINRDYAPARQSVIVMPIDKNVDIHSNLYKQTNMTNAGHFQLSPKKRCDLKLFCDS